MSRGKFWRFCTAARLKVGRRSSEYQPVQPVGIDPIFSGIIDAGLCTYLDCRDRLSLAEVADLNEVLIARYENERRAHAAAEAKAKRGNR